MELELMIILTLLDSLVERVLNKDDRSPQRATNSHILPSRLRGNYDNQKESRRRSNREHLQNHPMIINQIQDSVNHSRLSESKCVDILTPKSGLREGKALKTAKSHHSKVISDTRGTSDNDTSSTKVEKTSNYLQYDYFNHSENKRTPDYQIKFELHKQKAYLEKLTNSSSIAKNLYTEFNALGSQNHNLLTNCPTYINQLVMNSENGAPKGTGKDK